jgi:hypothetical protein
MTFAENIFCLVDCECSATDLQNFELVQPSQNLAFELVKLSLKLIRYTYSSSPLLCQNKRSGITQLV